MKNFESVAQLKLAKLKDGQQVTTKGYYTAGDGGDALYLIKTPQTFDGYGDHELANGNIAVLQLANGVADVKLFGAKGDDVNDDSDAIQAALNKSKTVVFPTGVYAITKALIIKDAQNISGNATIKIKDGAYTDTNFWMMTNTTKPIPYNYDAGVPFVNNIHISGLSFDGNSSGATMTGNVGAIFFDQSNFCTVDSVSIDNINQGGGGSPAIRLFYSNNAVVSNCDIQNTDRQGVGAYESSVAVSDCFIKNSKEREPVLCSTHNPQQLQAGSMDIIRCELENTTTTNGTHVVRFSGETSGSVRDCLITGLPTINGVYITYIEDHVITVEGNTIRDCLYGALVESDGYKDLTFKNNRYENCEDGLRVNAASINGIVRVIGETFNVTNQPIYLNFIDNMIVKDCFVDGGSEFSFASGMKSLVFSDNTIINTTVASQCMYAIGSALTSPAVMQGNIAHGNTADAFRFDGTGAVNGSVRVNGAGGSFVHFASMGDAYIWRNGANLYMKSFSYPTSVTDGVLVGTQS